MGWDRLARWILLSTALVLAYGYITRIDKPNTHVRMALHEAIVSQDSLAPYRYRVLVPVTTEMLIRPLSALMPRKEAFGGVYGIYEAFAITLMLLSLYAWLRRFYEPALALVGCLFVSATVPMAFKDHYFHPWSLLEPGLLTLGLIAIAKERIGVLLAVTVLASLNRETGIFIPLLWGAMKCWDGGLWDREKMGIFLMLLFASMLTLVGVLWIQGYAPPLHTPASLLLMNISWRNLGRTLINGVLFLGVFWVFVVKGYARSPKDVRRSAWVVPLYLLLIGIWGLWHEVRLLMPLYPILIPLALAFLRDREGGDKVEGVASGK